MNNNDIETNQDNLSRQQIIRLRQSDKKKLFRCKSSITFDRRSSRKKIKKKLENNENINTDNTNVSIFQIYSSNEKFNNEKDESDDKLNNETIYSNCCNFFEENNDIGKNKSNMNNPNEKNNHNRKTDFNFNYLNGYERYERLNEKLPMLIKKEIEDEEKTLLKKLNINNNLDIKNVKFIAGVDTTYAGESELIGCAALVVFRKDNIGLCYHEYFYGDFTIPYCPSYLNRREGNVYFRLLRDLEHSNETKPDVILVDGNGIIHTRGCGLATYFGIKIEIPTIGISKKPCNVGYFDSKIYDEMKCQLTKRGQSAPIYNYKKNLVGFLYKSTDIDDPIIINPGQLINPQSALEIVKFCCRGHKLPEPIYYADKFTRIIMNNRENLRNNDKLNIWNFEKAKDKVYEELKKYGNFPILNTEKEPFEENEDDSEKNNENCPNEIESDNVPPYSPVISDYDVRSNDEFIYESFENNDQNKIKKNNSNIGDNSNKNENNKSNNIDIDSERTNNKQNQKNNIDKRTHLKYNLEEIIEEKEVNSTSKKNIKNKEISEGSKNKIISTQDLLDNINSLINDEKNNKSKESNESKITDEILNNKIIERKNKETKSVLYDLHGTDNKIIERTNKETNTVLYDSQSTDYKIIERKNKETKHVLYDSQSTNEKIITADTLQSKTKNNEIKTVFSDSNGRDDKINSQNIITNTTVTDTENTNLKKVTENTYHDSKDIDNFDERSYHSMFNLKYRRRRKCKNKESQKETDLFTNCKLYLTHDFRGINNFGNTCYINSVIQLLYSCDIFYNLIVHSTVIGETQTLLRIIFLEINSGILPDTTKLINKLGFQLCISQDAQEAIQKILGNLKDEFKNTLYMDIYKYLFTVGTHTFFKCKQENIYEHLHEKDEDNITLQIPLANTIENCFKDFTEDKIDSFKCDKFNTEIKNLKRNILFNFLPIFLIISLKRFNNKFGKNNKICEIKEELDLKEFSLNNTTNKYLLDGIIIHKENKGSVGHYMYLRKNEVQDLNKTGILYNDDLIYYCNFWDVVNFCKGNNSFSYSESNYILLYIQINHDNYFDHIESDILHELTQKRPKLQIKNRYINYNDLNDSYNREIKPENNNIDFDENINNKIILPENYKNKKNNNIFYDPRTFLDIFSDKYGKGEDLKIFKSKTKESKFIKKIKNNQKKDKDSTIGLYEAEKNYDTKLNYIDMKISDLNYKNSHFIRFDKLNREALEKELNDRTKKGCIIQTKRYWNFSIDYLEKKGSQEWNLFMKNFREMYGKMYIMDYQKDENGNKIKSFIPTKFKRNSNIDLIIDLKNYYYFPFFDVDEFNNFIKSEINDNKFSITKREFNKFKYICPICITDISVENMTRHFLTNHYYSVHLVYWDDIGDRIEEFVNWNLTTKFERCIFYIKAFAGLFYLIYKYKNNEIKNESLLEKLSVLKHYINLDIINKLFLNQLKESEANNTINICEILFCEYFEENLKAAKKKRVNKLYLDNIEKIELDNSEEDDGENNNKNKEKMKKNNLKKDNRRNSNKSKKDNKKNINNNDNDEVDIIDESDSDSQNKNSRNKKESNKRNKTGNEDKNKRSYSKKENKNRKKK